MRTFILSFFVLYYTFTNAQIQYSAEVGQSSTMVYLKLPDNSTPEGVSSKFGYYAALNFGSQCKKQWQNIEIWAIGSIALDNRGYLSEVTKYDGENTSGYRIYNLNYLSIPAYFQPRVYLNDKDSYFSINIGGHLSHLLDANYKYTGAVVTLIEDAGKDKRKKLKVGDSYTDDFKPFDTGVIVGIGAGWNDFAFNLNLKLSLQNIASDTRYTIMNEAFTWSICYNLAYL